MGEERRTRLASLVRTGSVTAIRALAEELAVNGCCPKLARHIGSLADDFDLARLRQLVEGNRAMNGQDDADGADHGRSE
jgi:hypothetical protein